jgi:AP-1 complex subunit beta-1
MVQRVLTMATEESDNPDLRDRGYVYWRLLSSDPEAARAVVLSEKPEISDDTFSLDPHLLEELLSNLATLSSVYHKPPEAFVMKTFQQSNADDDDDDDEYMEEEMPTEGGGNSYGGDLLDLDVGGGDQQQSTTSGGGLDLLGFDSPTESGPPSKPSLVTSEAGHGVFINGMMTKIDGQLCLDLDVGNSTPTPFQNFAVQFNKNTFGICPSSAQLVLSTAVSNGSSTPARINLAVTPQMLNQADPNLNLQVAVKNSTSGNVFYFTAPIAMECLMAATPAMEIQNLITSWRSIDEALEASVVVNDLPTTDIEAVKAKLTAHNINFSAAKEVQPGQHVVYFSCKTITNSTFLVELKFKAGMNVAKVTVRSPNKGLSELCKVTVGKLLSK